MWCWFRQYKTIAWNAFVVTLGNPSSLIIQLTILGCGILLACLPFFTFGEQLRLIRDQSLALCFLCGCIASVLGAATLVVDDIRRGAAAITMSRPVSGLCYIAGKWTGLMLSLCFILATACTACLWLTRITAVEEHLDRMGILLYLSAVAVALILMGVKHYFLGGCYVWQANLAILVCFLSAFAAGVSLNSPVHAGVDWKTLEAGVLITAALTVFSSLTVMYAVMFDTGILLAASVITFFGGLLSEHVLRTAALGSWGLTLGRAILPNWQLFWISDRLAEGGRVPLPFICHCLIHSLLYAMIVLCIAALFFGRRELGGSE